MNFKRARFRARYVDIYQNEIGWIYWNAFGIIVSVEYDDGSKSCPDSFGHIDINDINESTIEKINKRPSKLKEEEWHRKHGKWYGGTE